jgi:hypothetical protein
MHLLAIFLQYLLGRLAGTPQKQPAVARARSQSASRDERQASESSSPVEGSPPWLASAIVKQAQRAAQRGATGSCGSGDACRAGPLASVEMSSVDASTPAQLSETLTPASLAFEPQAASLPAVSAVVFSSPQRS